MQGKENESHTVVVKGREVAYMTWWSSLSFFTLEQQKGNPSDLQHNLLIKALNKNVLTKSVSNLFTWGPVEPGNPS